MSNYCCQHCFTEKNIVQFISLNGTFIGSCSYCEFENVQGIEPAKIFEFIERFYFGLDEDETGEKLFDILKSKYCFFEDRVLDKEKLFQDILIDSNLSFEKKYKIPSSEEIKIGWIEFSQEIKAKNRFFPQTSLYKKLFTNTKDDDASQTDAFLLLLESLTKNYSTGRKFYRARVHDSRLPIAEMKAPPTMLVTAGRANPIGISYLYLAENEKTCIAEVRPSNGCMVSVATFSLKENLKLLDLTSPRKRASFLIQESEHLIDSLIHIDLLEIFAEELSKPVLPNKSHLDYIPTQFLCEYFKVVCGFHGLIFNSSFGNGKNIVLFDQTLVDNDSMKYFSISRTDYEFNEV